MKKEKGRNLTLEQLEKRINIVKKIIQISLWSMIIIVIAGMILVGSAFNKERYIVEELVVIVLTVSNVIICISANKKMEYLKKIDTIEKQKKADEIKKLGQTGNIKDLVYIKDPEIIMCILLQGFKAIKIVDHTEDLFFVKILLNGQDEFSMTTTISKKEFLNLLYFNLLYDDEKQQLLDQLVDRVEVETIQDENAERTKLQIAMKKDFLYTNTNATDEELLEKLKLKK